MIGEQRAKERHRKTEVRREKEKNRRETPRRKFGRHYESVCEAIVSSAVL